MINFFFFLAGVGGFALILEYYSNLMCLFKLGGILTSVGKEAKVDLDL